MFESLVFLISKVEQLLTALKPLMGTALSEYVTEQSMHGALNSHWAGIFWAIAIGGVIMLVIGVLRMMFSSDYSDWGAPLSVAGTAILIIAGLVAIVLTAESSACHIREATPTLQLLKTFL